MSAAQHIKECLILGAESFAADMASHVPTNTFFLAKIFFRLPKRKKNPPRIFLLPTPTPNP